MPDPERDARIEADYRLIEGREAFHATAVAMVSAALRDVVIFSYELDRLVFGSEAFLQATRKFTLQHTHARMRVLVNAAGRTARNAHRLVELGRQLTSYIEFRDPPEEYAALTEEYIITDGRCLLYRQAPDQLAARYFQTLPHMARLKLREFEPLWDESQPTHELRNLRI